MKHIETKIITILILILMNIGFVRAQESRESGLVFYTGSLADFAPDHASEDGTYAAAPSASKQFGDWTATCTWSISNSLWSEVYVSARDTDGNLIDNILTTQKHFVAGRYVELNVYEKKGYEIKVNYNVVSIKKEVLCETCEIYCQKHLPPSDSTSIGKCDIWGQYCNSNWVLEGNCDGNIIGNQDVSRDPTTEEINWCRDVVANNITSYSLTPSYEVNYSDSNDININNKTSDKYNTNATIKGTSSCNNYGGSGGGNTIGQTYKSSYTESQECTFSYNRGLACINKKTGKVRYIDGDTCEEEELKIENYDGYWKYFIPLNTKSDSGFSFRMLPTNDKQDVGICENIINKYDNYKDLITYEKGITFSETDTKETSIGKVKNNNGCYYQTTVTIPTEQKFYNEVDDNGEKIFKGFSFYYRPIDINNPFPNGIANDSYWKQWSESNDPTPDLSKSFEKITYTAYNINASSVREYNLDNLYTSWENMNLDGSSSYISNNEIITRNVNKNSFYKLGCGPANKDWSECQ